MVHKKNLVAAIKCNGRTLRENGEEVYLPFGSNYSILLKNLNTTKALVDVYVDGQEVITGLIVRPKQETEVERFFEKSMNSGHKLKFIEKNKDISDFRGDYIEDGLVRIEYRFEKQRPSPFIEEPGIHYKWPWECRPDRGEPWWIYSDDNTSGNVRNMFIGSASQDNHGLSNTDKVENIMNVSEDALYSYSTSYQSQQPQHNEQGITTQGEYSDQSFVYGNIGSLEINSYSIVLQLKGYYPSQQEVKEPLTTREKIRCKMCGRKWRSDHKFCGNCGTYLV